VRAETEFSWFRIGFSGGFLWTRYWNLKFHKRQAFLELLSSYQLLRNVLLSLRVVEQNFVPALCTHCKETCVPWQYSFTKESLWTDTPVLYFLFISYLIYSTYFSTRVSWRERFLWNGVINRFSVSSRFRRAKDNWDYRQCQPQFSLSKSL
jgi:hypothetical protein